MWFVGLAGAVWWVNAHYAAAHARLSLTDTHWPGEWPNLLCPHDAALGCAGGALTTGWPLGLPPNLDAEARSQLTRHPWDEVNHLDPVASASGRLPLPVHWAHVLVGVYEGPQAQHPRTVLLVYASKFPAWECHACAPWASFFEFEAEGLTGWRMTKAVLGAAQQGAWGEMAPIHVLPLSDHQIGVWFAMGYTAQGFTTETLAAYAWSGGKLRLVWEELVGERDGNEQDVSWQAHWRFAGLSDGRLTVDLQREPGPEALSGAFMRRKREPGASGTDADGQLARRTQWQFDGERFVATGLTN